MNIPTRSMRIIQDLRQVQARPFWSFKLNFQTHIESTASFYIQASTRVLSTGENVQKWTRYFLLFFRRVRATSMTRRRVENTRVHFWTFSPVSVKMKLVNAVQIV